MKWQTLTEPLSLDKETFIQRYGTFADMVELLRIDVDQDGAIDNVARFQYASGAGCGSNRSWLVNLSEDLRSLATGPLNSVLSKIGGDPINVYAEDNRYYIDGALEGEGLLLINGKQIDRACTFQWRRNSFITRLFSVH